MTAARASASPRPPLALVTGASRGIGAAIARALVADGWAVLVAARGREGCERMARALVDGGAVARPLALDVADPAAIEAAADAVDALADELGPLAALVNNAGIAESAPLVTRSGPRHGANEALYERLFAVNFHGARRLAEAFLPGFKARGRGHVVNVASSAGLRGYAYVSAYCASKFALVGWTLAAAAELEASGVRVNAVCPHYVDSDMLEASIERIVEKTGQAREDVRAFLASENPGGRLIAPSEVADAVRALLAGDETGTLVELDGGPERRVHSSKDAGRGASARA